MALQKVSELALGESGGHPGKNEYKHRGLETDPWETFMDVIEVLWSG